MSNNDNFWLNVAAAHYLSKESKSSYNAKPDTEHFVGKMVLFLICDALFIAFCLYILKR